MTAQKYVKPNGNVNVVQPTLSVQSFANVEESAMMNTLLHMHIRPCTDVHDHMYSQMYILI